MKNQLSRVIVLRGISGSGKSTFAQSLVPQGYYIVSRDTIRLDLLGSEGLRKYFSQGSLDHNLEEYVTQLEELQIAKHLIKHHKLVIDDTNLKKKYFQNLINLFAETDTDPEDVTIKEFPVDPCCAIVRLLHRPEKPVSDEVVLRQASSFNNCKIKLEDFLDEEGHWLTKGKLRQWFVPDFDTLPYLPNTNNPKAVIVDLDGTTSHRDIITEPKIHMRSFYEYHEVGSDTPDPLLKQIILGLQDQGVTPIFLSGRKCKVENEDGTTVDVEGITRKFITEELGVAEPLLFMRDPSVHIDSEGKDLRDDRLKHDLFYKNIASQYNVIGAFDDRARVCAVWEDIDIKCLNCSSINQLGRY